MTFKNKMSLEERRRKQKESMQKLREARRNNQALYEQEKKKERERYFQRKARGKIKEVGQMSARDLRAQRKEWRKRSKKCYDRKKQQEQLEKDIALNSPPMSPEPEENVERVDKRRDSGRKRRRKHTYHLKRKIAKLEEKLKKEKQKKDKYKMRLYRYETKKNDTPRQKVKKILKGQKVDEDVRKKLLFGEVIKDQLKENYKNLKQQMSKKIFWRNISGKVLKKYRMTNRIVEIISYSYVGQRNTLKERKHKKKVEAVRLCVIEFLHNDENSRETAGKKECITRKKIKKQRRYLNSSMKTLYKNFCNKYTNIKLSYSLFCKFRPFWILPASADKRSTCLCILHTNVDYMTKKLKHLKLIKECSPEDLKTSLCCAKTERTMTCYNRKCSECKNKEIQAIREFSNDNEVKYERWIKICENVDIKGKIKKCTKTVKETVVTTEKNLLLSLNKTMPSFLKHLRNISHQYSAIDGIKKGLTEDDILIHCDFSENYECKYKEEVQAAHFGGSKAQLSLHTVVVYYKSGDEIKPQSFCSISECLRHDTSSVCAHLTPVIQFMKTVKKDLNQVHFLSDGPTSQYRNRKMFYLIATYLPKVLDAKVIKWHYTEQGHGKGAPDGVGGCLKRSADQLVGTGKDITNVKSFFKELGAYCPSIKLFIITKEDIQAIDKILPKDLTSLVGTLKVHEITWTKASSLEIYAKRVNMFDMFNKTRMLPLWTRKNRL